MVAASVWVSVSMIYPLLPTACTMLQRDDASSLGIRSFVDTVFGAVHRNRKASLVHSDHVQHRAMLPAPFWSVMKFPHTKRHMLGNERHRL